MVKRRATYEILREVRDAMPKTVTGSGEWIDNLDGTFTLDTCSTLWVYPGLTVIIDGTGYIVKSFVNNESLTITAISAPGSTSFDLALPYFWNGTIMFTDTELSKIDNAGKKFPMIFFHDGSVDFEEVHNYDDGSNLGMSCEPTLYFMKSADFSSWTQENHRKYAVAPMRNMAQAFVETLLDFSGVMRKPVPEARFKDQVKWGNATVNGHDKELILGQLSGTRLKINELQFEKSICKCEC